MPPVAKKAPKKIPTSLAALRDSLTKTYGDGRVTRQETITSYEVVPTGSLSLDLALRTGGWVAGRIHEIVGPPGVGKSTLVINSMAQAQKLYPDLACGYIDMEQTFDFSWAQAQGLDVSGDRFLHIYPNDSEDVADQLKAMIETGLFKVLVVDSIGGMESKQAFDKDAGEQVMGRNAQVITRMVKRVAGLARQHGVVVLLVNQHRANISNPMGRDISAGPKALQYATSTSVALSRTGEPPLKVRFPGESEDDVVGYQTKARVQRSKVSPQGRTATFWIINQPSDVYGPIGIDQADEAMTIGVATRVIEQQAGGYYWMPWTKDAKERIRGRDSVLSYLRENPEKVAIVRDEAVKVLSHEVISEVQVDFATGEVLAEEETA